MLTRRCLLTTSPRSPTGWRVPVLLLALLLAPGFHVPSPGGSGSLAAFAEPPLPELTEPVNDLAQTIDGSRAQVLDRALRSLKDETGDVVVMVTVPHFEPYGDSREYAAIHFQN